MTFDRLPWEELNKPLSGFNMLRVDSAHFHDFFWGKESSGNYLLLLGIAEGYEEFIKKNSISLRGIKTDLRVNQTGENFYILALQNSQNADIFLRLCNDLLESTKGTSDTLEALKLLHSRLKRWKSFLSHEGGHILSQIEVQGLFAELKFIEECIDNNHIQPIALLEGWKGPLDGPQDFVFGDFAVEIKSIAGIQKDYMKISSENQLTTHLKGLYLYVYFLGEYHNCDKGKSLNEMVKIIQNKINDQDLTQVLDRRLDNAGYIELKDYDIPCFEVTKRNIYEVRNNFPRITSESLQEGILNVTYKIKLDSIKEFLFDSSFFGKK